MESKSSKFITLATSVQYVKGIGPRRAELLKKVDVETIEDLVTYFPRRYIDRSHLKQIRSVRAGEETTIVGRVYSCDVKKGRKERLIVLVGDGSGFLQCVWFRGISYMSKAFKVGDTVAFSGKVTMYQGPQLIHPEYDKISEEGEADTLHTGGIIPLYPSTEFLSRVGLDGRGFRRVLRLVLNALLPDIEETLSESIIANRGLVSRTAALENIHFPRNWDAFKRAQFRLKFEELFFLQLFLALERNHRITAQKGIAFTRRGDQVERLLKTLPFSLTKAQERVLHELREDMSRGTAMNRLLQGDVGSGKTVIALIAMLIAVENGYQAAIMAPTEILAEQHYVTLQRFLDKLGIRVALLKGSLKEGEKRDLLEKLAGGEIQIAVGTHALVQKGVRFHRLGFVVIDEQHRFGVMQRATLRRMGIFPDVLVMTATPIPRTLALTLYGDLDVSVLDEIPEGRSPVRTAWRSEDKRREIYDYVKDEVQAGRQAYVVYPLVEESEKVDLAAATEGYEKLAKTVFPDLRVALLHGRMRREEKEDVMKRFKQGTIDLLVSTTVIEVGIDVPNATVMLVEHAERFGLTQLHQLRGRVGRGSARSVCILITQGFISDDARKRMETMVRLSDGFRIADVDLEMRGPGELFGTRQHGLLNFKISNLVTDGRILHAAREEAFRLVKEDPALERSENACIKKTYQTEYKNRFGLIQVG